MRSGIYCYYPWGWPWEQAPYLVTLLFFDWEYKEEVIFNEWLGEPDMRGNAPSTYQLVEVRDGKSVVKLSSRAPRRNG